MTREITTAQAKEAERSLLDTTWRPGQSGNPIGRPKEPDDLMELLKVLVGKENAKRIFKNLIFLAAPPEDSKVPYHVQLGAISEILDRLVGKPRQVDTAAESPGAFLIGLVEKFVRENDITPEGRAVIVGSGSIPRIAPTLREDVSAESWPELPG